MTYNTNDIETMKKLISLALDNNTEAFNTDDVLYVTGKALCEYPELKDYDFQNYGFKLQGRVNVTRKYWWQFWIPKISPAIVFIYKPGENIKI